MKDLLKGGILFYEYRTDDARLTMEVLKQAVSLQFGRLLREKALTKSDMAARMKTSRAAVDRLLDASNSSITLNTLGKAAHALNSKIEIELVPAE